jgi:hypothetical protein
MPSRSRPETKGLPSVSERGPRAIKSLMQHSFYQAVMALCIEISSNKFQHGTCFRYDFITSNCKKSIPERCGTVYGARG